MKSWSYISGVILEWPVAFDLHTLIFAVAAFHGGFVLCGIRIVPAIPTLALPFPRNARLADLQDLRNFLLGLALIDQCFHPVAVFLREVTEPLP